MPTKTETKTYTAVRRVRHNDDVYGPGLPAGIEMALTDAQAQPLIDLGAVVLQADVAPDDTKVADPKAVAPAKKR